MTEWRLVDNTHGDKEARDYFGFCDLCYRSFNFYLGGFEESGELTHGVCYDCYEALREAYDEE